MENNKKLVVFDWGDVLLDVNSPVYNSYTAIKNIGRDMGFEQHSFIRFLKKREFWTKGGAELDQLICSYLKEINSDKTVDDFKDCYLSHFRKITWFEEMIDFLKSIHDEGVSTGIISNLCQLDGDLLAEKLPMDKIDYRFYSYNLGVEKPDDRIYEIVETVSGCKPENIFFVDDKQKNVDAAVARGWNGICATGDEIVEIKKAYCGFVREPKMVSRELSITDTEELNELAEWIISTFRFECYKFDNNGNILTDVLKYNEDNDVLEKLKSVLDEAYYFRFDVNNSEFMKISFSEALNMSLDVIKEKYLKEHLPKLRAILRKDSLYQGARPSDDIPDSYLDDLLALRWKENLKLCTRLWEFQRKMAERK